MPTLAIGRADPFVVLRIIWLAMLIGLLLTCGIGALVVGTGTVQPSAFPPAATWSLAGFALLELLLAPVLERRIGASGAPPAGDPAARAMRGQMLGLALRESAGILGMVLGLLTGELRWILLVGGAAIAAMLLAFPRRTS